MQEWGRVKEVEFEDRSSVSQEERVKLQTKTTVGGADFFIG